MKNTQPRLDERRLLRASRKIRCTRHKMLTTSGSNCTVSIPRKKWAGKIEQNKLVPQQRLERGFNKQVALIMGGRSGRLQLEAAILLLPEWLSQNGVKTET